MRNWAASAWFLSTSIFTSCTLGARAATSFSSAGPSVLHGPHHSAQKSTSTSAVFDASMTSRRKASILAFSAAGLGMLAKGDAPDFVAFDHMGCGGPVCQDGAWAHAVGKKGLASPKPPVLDAPSSMTGERV